MPVILPTDALFFVLLAMAAATALYVRGREHMRAPWRRVFRTPIAAATAVVLGAFLAVAVLDSLHFHPRLDRPSPRAAYSEEIISVLDWIATPLRQATEKTYSAPFALHLYVKEPIEGEDGTTRFGYPRLRFAGRRLADDGAGRGRDIAATAVAGALEGAGVWLPGALTLVAWSAWRRRRPFARRLADIATGGSEAPWRVGLATAAALAVALGMAVELSLQYHILGTDKVGEDVFYQSFKSIRTGILIGTLTTMVMLPLAVGLGIAAGYFRGWVDDVIQYLYTTLNAIPGVLLIAAAVLMLHVYMSSHADEFNSVVQRADLRLLFLCLILGLTSWTGLCRLLRGETLKLRQLEYIQAARAFGVSDGGILARHVLPNVMHIVFITVVLDFSALVLAEAVLSYIQIGVDPSTYSWGNMINSARLELAREPVVWWSLAAAMGFMFTLVLCANLFADVVRDAFDPRLRTEVLGV